VPEARVAPPLVPEASLAPPLVPEARVAPPLVPEASLAPAPLAEAPRSGEIPGAPGPARSRPGAKVTARRLACAAAACAVVAFSALWVAHREQAAPPPHLPAAPPPRPKAAAPPPQPPQSPAPRCPPPGRRCSAPGGPSLVHAGELYEISVPAASTVNLEGRWGCSPEVRAASVDLTTGDVWMFDSWPPDLHSVVGRLVARVPPAVAVRVAHDSPGCDYLRVTTRAGKLLTVDPAAP
jgi:hypothetical protein